jgi:hypothetical protein
VREMHETQRARRAIVERKAGLGSSNVAGEQHALGFAEMGGRYTAASVSRTGITRTAVS